MDLPLIATGAHFLGGWADQRDARKGEPEVAGVWHVRKMNAVFCGLSPQGGEESEGGEGLWHVLITILVSCFWLV